MTLEDFRAVRIEKLQRLRQSGINPYPAQCDRTHRISEALEAFDDLAKGASVITLAGRVMAQRGHGALTFLDINDGTGTIQAIFKKDELEEGVYDLFTSVIDIGDIVAVTGPLFLTKRNERTVAVKGWDMLTKAIRPLPEKWHGLQDVEERYRARHIDLIFNPDVKTKFLARFSIIQIIRDFFREHGYLEVETPTLQVIPGGATAEPFETHMNDLDLDLFLRVAPELYLKRLLVGGFERVFEIGKNFRNEGMDRDHNPEFTMLEAYAAYKDYEWLMGMTEDLVVRLVTQLFGKPEVTYQGQTIAIAKPFKRVTFNELVKEASGLDFDSASKEDFAAKANELGVVVEKAMTKSVLADEIYKKTLRAKMMEPVFVINHPIELSPLSKKISPESDKVARFQLLVGGFEMTNAFSELNDPQDQLERFQAQQDMRDEGSDEAHRLDMEYIEALEYGMPPAAGIGIGIDRLVAFLTDSHSLRDILLFPTMKPKE